VSDEPTIGPHLPPYHVVPGEGPEGYLHRTADPDPLIASLTAENEQLFHDNIDYQEEIATLRRLLGRLRFLIGPVDDDALIGFMERAIDRANVLETENDRLRAEVAEWRDEAWRASYDADNMKTNIVAIRELWSNIVVLELGDDVPVAAFPLAHHEAIERLLNGQAT
jgi:FtsZ-binding cell division protein ZapB